ncbi:unnamed protein product [Boreogadus saida]
MADMGPGPLPRRSFRGPDGWGPALRSPSYMAADQGSARNPVDFNFSGSASNWIARIAKASTRCWFGMPHLWKEQGEQMAGL